MRWARLVAGIWKTRIAWRICEHGDISSPVKGGEILNQLSDCQFHMMALLCGVSGRMNLFLSSLTNVPSIFAAIPYKYYYQHWLLKVFFCVTITVCRWRVIYYSPWHWYLLNAIETQVWWTLNEIPEGKSLPSVYTVTPIFVRGWYM
jgi:hypothetical protein